MIGIDQLKRRIGELEGPGDELDQGPRFIFVDESHFPHDEAHIGRTGQGLPGSWDWIFFDQEHPPGAFMSQKERNRFPDMILSGGKQTRSQ
jgi:hypothetical protein